MSRAQIAEYLEALHAADSDSETPFRLIWQAIRGRSANADADAILRAPLSPGAIAADTLQRLRGELAIHAGKAQHFLDVHGHAATSPWAMTPPGDVPAYDHEALLSALQAWRTALAERAVIVERQRALGIETDADAAAAEAADARLPEAPDPAALLALLAVPEMAQLGEGLELLASLYAARSRVAALAVAEYDRDDLVRAGQLARRIKREDYLARTPAEIYRLAEYNIACNRSFIDTVAALRPAIEAFGPGDAVPASHVEAIAKTVASLAGLDETRADWMSAEAEGPALERVYQRWLALRREESELRTTMPGVDAAWPSADDLDAARAALLKTGFGKLFGQKPGREMLDRLRLPDTPSSRDLLQRLATHVRNTMAFAAHAEGRALLGDRWKALATPLDAAVDAARLRSDLRVRLGALAGGVHALAALTAMAPAAILALGRHRAAAESYLAGLAEFRDVADATPLGSAVTRAEANLATLQGLLALDPDRALAGQSESLAKLATKDEAAAARDAAETRLGQSAIADELRRLAPDEAALARCRAAIEWIRVVQRSGMPAQLATALLSAEAGTVRRRLHDEASERARADVATNRALEMLAPFGFAGLDGIAPSALQSHLDALLSHANELTDFVALQRTRRELDNAGLEQFLRAADAALLTPSRLPALFDAAVARRRAEAARRASRPLSERNGGDLEARRAAFVERDRQKKNTDRAAVKATLLGRQAPSGLRAGPVKTWTEMHLLAREFPKQRAFTPVRSLLARAGGAVRALKPCFMMSPLSLAKFLSPGQFEFDLLVIDEASQMKPEDALGAMLRAKQIVVVGDPKQLPPTSFFDRSATAAEGASDGDGDDVDDESILERCQKVFGDVRSLKWHYRSRCESLIRFSNDAFYQGRLITFPAAIPRSFSIDLVRVDGSFQASRNLVEAERICEEAISFMRDYADLDAPPTLGIVALNTEQRDLIQEMLWRLSAEDDLVARYAEKVETRGEPPFVKNLENVQGDERDYILISLTYGRAPGVAAMAQRFGPINSKQGHRRLNVLFSRARVRIGLFASFGSSDVKPTEGANQGVHVLKQYLEYAETRGRTAANRVGGTPDSDFEVEVAERLRSRGYEIDLQVGVSGFRIDLGVRHPDRPDTFLAGIECDGAAYHGSRSARDRDRLREEVLRGLGWAIIRVWSTDWFDNPDAQTERLVKRLEDLRHEPDSHERGPRRFGFPAEGAGPDELAVEKDTPAEPIDGHEDTEMATSAAAEGGPEPAPTGEGPSIAPDHAGTTGSPAAAGEALLQGDAALSEAELTKALVAFRETVVRPAAGADWDPQRSILREGMIETLVRQRIDDPEDWFRRVPFYQRSATEPNEKRLYLDRVCALIARLDDGSGQTRAAPGSVAAETGAGEWRQENSGRDAIEPSGQGSAALNAPVPGFGRPSAAGGTYERTDFTALGLTPKRDSFYDSDYRPELGRLVAAVIEAEGPIYEDILAVRIARAHGMERTGTTIQQIVAGAVDHQFARSTEEDRTVFWPLNARPDRPFAHRSSPDGVRSHADTPLAELAGLALPFLRLGMDDEAVIGRVTQHFGLGRLRAATRQRFEKAISIAKSHLGS